MCDIVIPEALQIVLDDLGWFCGKDDRESGGASRTGCRETTAIKTMSV